MKKLLVLLLALIMCLTALTSCDVNDILGYIIKPVETVEYDTDSALAYLKNMYKGENSVTATDYEVIGQIYISGVKYTVTWTSSNDKVKVEALENGNWLINVDEKSETEETYTLTATITAENGDTRTHSYERSVPKYNVLSWDQYMKAAENDVVLVEGIVVGMNSVSKGNKRNHLFLADASGKGGYYCYILTSDPVTDGIEIGMTVSVSGTVSPYSGMQEIKNCTATIVDKTIKDVTPVDMTSVFSQATPDYSEYVGRLVTIKGVKIGSQDLATETSQYLYFTIGGVKGYVRTYVTDMCHEVANNDAKKTIDEAHAAHFGWTADATGILILYSGNPYLIPVSTTPFEYKELVQATAAEKIADSADSISIASKVASDTTIELPLKGANYGDVTIAWTSNNECATVGADGKLTIKLQDEAQTVTLTATLTCGETVETRTFTIEVAAKPKVDIVVVDAPVVGNEYYLMVEQGNLGTNLFFTGAMNGYYYATTEDYTTAVKVKVLEATGGYYLQVGENYIGIEVSGTYTNVKLHTAATTVFVWNTEYKTFTTNIDGTDYYIGSYKTFATFSASKLSYISTSFPSHLVTIGADTVIADGEYTIAAGDTFIGALGETATYGYLPKSDTAVAFTVKNVAGGVTIQDSYGRFLYMSGTHNSFQIGTEAPADGSHIWKVTKNDDGTYTFVNAVTEKTIAYSASYSSAGAYATVADGNVANLTLTAKGGSEEHTHNITDDNFTPEQPATCTSVGKKGHFYCEVCQKAFDRDGNEIEDLTIEALGHDFNIWGDCSRCEHTEKVELKVYYKNTKNWENVYVWAWYDGGQNICGAAGLSWPGLPISKVDGTDDWYVASVNLHTLANIKLLFNGGVDVGQTQDVVYDGTKIYMYNNNLYATQAEADAAYTADSSVTWSDLYIRGDMNNWGTSNQLKVDPADESAYIEIELIAGQKFKIATDSWSYEINWSFVQDTVNFEADGSDIKVVNSGTYTFVVSKDWSTLTITKKVEEHTHEWGTGTVTTEPTCTEKGVKTFTCACGETKTEDVDALGHADENGDFLCDHNCGKVMIEDGDYSIKADDVAMGTLAASKNYGYIPSSECGVITIKNVEGGYTLQDVFGRYLYMSDIYDSFNLSTEPTTGHIFTIASNGDGKFTIVNIAKNKTLCYTSYKTFGAYASVGTNVADLSIAASTHKHSYDSVTVTTEPKDCATSGKGLTTCACGHTKDEVAVAPLAHKCENGAYCSVCGRWIFEANKLAKAPERGDVDGTTELGYFTLIWKSESSKIDASTKTWDDGYTSSQRINFGGKLNVSGGVVSSGVKFTTTEATTVRIWWASGKDNSQMVIYTLSDEGKFTEITKSNVTSTKNSPYYSELTLTAANTYYLGGDINNNYIFKIEVDHTHTYGEDDKCACGAEKPAEVTTYTETKAIKAAEGTYDSTAKTISWTSDNFTFVGAQAKSSYVISTKTTDHYRAYQGSTFTISAKDGCKIQKIVIKTTGSKNITSSSYVTTAGVTVTCNGSTCTIEGTDLTEVALTGVAQFRISSIEITYTK